MTIVLNNADLAEFYQADQDYEPGTVMEFGGAKEITQGTKETRRVAGVVSTNPAQVMNGGAKGQNLLPIALVGRVPCKVIGPVTKGDLMISAGFGYACSHPNPAIGQVIGKAVQDNINAKAVIEIVVGRL